MGVLVILSYNIVMVLRFRMKENTSGSVVHNNVVIVVLVNNGICIRNVFC